LPVHVSSEVGLPGHAVESGINAGLREEGQGYILEALDAWQRNGLAMGIAGSPPVIASGGKVESEAGGLSLEKAEEDSRPRGADQADVVHFRHSKIKNRGAMLVGGLDEELGLLLAG
jgi:hypothetical protein